MFVKLGRKLASQDSKTRVVCDGKLMWKKNPRENLVLKSRFLVFTFLLPLTPFFLVLCSSLFTWSCLLPWNPSSCSEFPMRIILLLPLGSSLCLQFL